MGTAGPSPHDWREWRRLRAWDLTQQGWSQHDIAVALDASKGAVSQWIQTARKGGREALRSHTSPGHPAKLTLAQKSQIPDFLWHGAEAYGFRGEVWTCTRVAQVIEWEFGICYHKDHVSRLLKDLGWTPQIPITRAIQRDEHVAILPLLPQREERNRQDLRRHPKGDEAQRQRTAADETVECGLNVSKLVRVSATSFPPTACGA